MAATYRAFPVNQALFQHLVCIHSFQYCSSPLSYVLLLALVYQGSNKGTQSPAQVTLTLSGTSGVSASQLASQTLCYTDSLLVLEELLILVRGE